MEPTLIQSLIDWISQHPTWAGLIIFLFAMGESLTVVGVLVPGVGVMLGVGALITTGALEFSSAFWWASAGAIVGDALSFWVGYHFKDRIPHIRPFNRYPQLFVKGEAFFEKHGGKSVFFGRFFGPVRAIIPTTAGMMHMSPWTFTLINISSGLLWALIYLGVGMAIGASLSLATEVATRLGLLLVVIGLGTWLSLWAAKHLYHQLAPRLQQQADRLLIWGRQHPHFGKVTAALVDPKHPEIKGLSILALLLVLLAWFIIALFSQFTNGPLLMRLDSSTYHLLQGLRTPWADQFLIIVSQLGDGRIHIALMIIVSAWLLWRKHWLAAGHWLAAVGFGATAAWGLKQSLQLPRPGIMFEGAMAYGFPSAHVLLAVCSFGFLAVLIAQQISPAKRWRVYATAWIIISLIAFSRLYLGAHWLSDVLGGLIIGLIWVSALGLAFRRHLSPSIHIKGLIWVPIAVYLTVGLFHVITSYSQNVARYSQVIENTVIHAKDWQADAWQEAPSHRIDTWGQTNQPLNLQWAGPLSTLQQHFLARGWQTPVELSLGSAMLWLKPGASIDELPALPLIHDGRYPVWQAISPDKQQIIQLWPADISLQPNQQALWVGLIAEQKLKTQWGFNTISIHSLSTEALSRWLAQVQGLNYQLKMSDEASKTSAPSGATLLIWASSVGDSQ